MTKPEGSSRPRPDARSAERLLITIDLAALERSLQAGDILPKVVFRLSQEAAPPTAR